MIPVEGLPVISNPTHLTTGPSEMISGAECWRISSGANVNLFYVHVAPDHSIDLHSFCLDYKDAIVQIRSGCGELAIDGYGRKLVHGDLVDVSGGSDAQLINLSKYNLSLLLFMFST